MSEMSFFDRVAQETGLSQIFAAQTVRRACARAGIDAELMTPADLQTALPHLRIALALFLDPPVVEERMQALTALVVESRT